VNTILFDPVGGVSGDMLLAAMFDLGVPTDTVVQALEPAGIGAFEVVFERRPGPDGIVAGFCEVRTTEHDEQHEPHGHRGLQQIETIIDRVSTTVRAKNRARSVFRRLAEAEAAVHGIAVDDVHFHEVGAVDAIVDIVGGCVALEHLAVDTVCCTGFKVGTGTVTCAHGVLPVPAPATVRLLEGFPVTHTGIEQELTTPTGAAFLTTLSSGALPPGPCRLAATGTGHGQRQNSTLPNVLRAYLLGTAEHGILVDVLETDIDDDSPETTATLPDLLRAEGALDVTLTPVLMKKGRAGLRLTVLTDPGDTDRVADVLLTHSSTIGIRVHEARRICLPRQQLTVATPWGDVAAKRVQRPDGTAETIPEFESCRTIAVAHNIPVRRVMHAVRATAVKAEENELS